MTDHLDQLEHRSVHLLREAYANFKQLCMLWSIGKDSTVLLWLAARERNGERRATLFAACWAALPSVIVFGRSLNQEPLVMLFAALGVLAQEKIFAGDARWRWAWPVAMAGMMWSDWSGFVFVGLLFLAQLACARSHPPTRA